MNEVSKVSGVFKVPSSTISLQSTSTIRGHGHVATQGARVAGWRVWTKVGLMSATISDRLCVESSPVFLHLGSSNISSN
ncbi:hypothetical protein J6590_028364 [Homalodisca vitripennis]|nr:hypothetical protein J6590_028364 [Homalodisca vitripennis]